ncbi:hypothetical protein REPUB_Repub10bG0165000 [Reevesia pubescens]
MGDFLVRTSYLIARKLLNKFVADVGNRSPVWQILWKAKWRLSITYYLIALSCLWLRLVIAEISEASSFWHVIVNRASELDQLLPDQFLEYQTYIKRWMSLSLLMGIHRHQKYGNHQIKVELN